MKNTTLTFLLFVSSCRLDTDALTTVETLARDIPNIVIEQVIYKDFENNQLTQEVYAAEFRLFSRDELVQVAQGRVKTYRDGTALLDGQAVSAEYNQDTEDASVIGPIEIYYHPEKTRISAQKLDWVKEERLLTSTPDGVVKVQQDDGTQFQGRDFSVDMSTRTVSYGKQVTGELKTPEENIAGEASEEIPPNRDEK